MLRRFAPVAALVVASTALPVVAQETARLSIAATENDDGAVLTITREGGPVPAATATVAGGVLQVRFPEPVDAQIGALSSAAPRSIAAARLDPDRRTLRISLRRALGATVESANGATRIRLSKSATAAEAIAAAEPLAGAVSASLTVGQRPDLTRLSFYFDQGATSVAVAQSGERVDLRFTRAAEIDLATVRSTPPLLVKSVERPVNSGGRLTVSFTVDKGVRVRSFSEGARVIVDLLPPENIALGPPPPLPPDEPKQAVYVDPAPKGGVTPVEVTETGEETRISVNWAGQARAAAFQRGDAVWLLFDSSARYAVKGASRTEIQQVRGQGVTGLRVNVSPDIRLAASAEGNSWVFTLGPRRSTSPGAEVRRDIGVAGKGRLIVNFDRDGTVKPISDPIVGDRLEVALIAGPPRGVEGRRSSPEAAVLPSAHGAAVELRADRVGARFEHGALVVSQDLAEARAALEPVAPLLAIALLDVRREAAVAREDVLSTKDQLARRAADEGFESGVRPEARLALARFLIAHELAAEALGALRLAQVNQPQLEADPTFRVMRGAANVMMGRYRDAKTDLGASPLAEDPAAALWRGYVAAKEGDWNEARRQLTAGRPALVAQPPGWKARFELALAEALLELDAFDQALAAADRAMGAGSPTIGGGAQVIRARILAAKGAAPEALKLLKALQTAPSEEVSVRAEYEAARVERAMGAADQKTLERLEALRLRWRGDELEMAITQQLGGYYAQAGRWREALTTLRAGATRNAGHPRARAMGDDMRDLFERLFLDGEADKMEPVQALGLFYDFKTLTPPGPNGDRIVRNLAGRLVKLDLLEQAAALLQYQVEQRLQGVSRAQVAADLAMIYLEDRKPEKALVALEMSRQPKLPPSIVGQRRILEAKALMDLNRIDQGVEMLERDQSIEAQQLRAEAAWRARDWPKAAAELERLMALRPKSGPLDESDRGAIMREATARVFAGDEKGVAAVRERYGARMAETPDAATFELVTSTTVGEGETLADVARSVARTDLLDRFMRSMKERMSTPAPAQGT